MNTTAKKKSSGNRRYVKQEGRKNLVIFLHSILMVYCTEAVNPKKTVMTKKRHVKQFATALQQTVLNLNPGPIT